MQPDAIRAGRNIVLVERDRFALRVETDVGHARHVHNSETVCEFELLGEQWSLVAASDELTIDKALVAS